MKNLIKEICKREAGKSEVNIGNVREVLKHLADVLADPKSDGQMGNDFAAYCAERSLKITKRRSICTINFQYVVEPEFDKHAFDLMKKKKAKPVKKADILFKKRKPKKK